MTLDVYRGRKTTIQQQQQLSATGIVLVFSSARAGPHPFPYTEHAFLQPTISATRTGCCDPREHKECKYASDQDDFVECSHSPEQILRVWHTWTFV